MQTIAEFATEQLIGRLLIKERVKCSRKYERRVKSRADRGLKPTQKANAHTNASGETSKLDLLSSMLPCRNRWIRPRNRELFLRPDSSLDKRKVNAKSLQLTIQRDKKLRKKILEKAVPDIADKKELEQLAYLDRLSTYIKEIQELISGTGELHFESPLLKALYKDKKTENDITMITFRPLAIYTNLRDKIILAIASLYLAKKFDWYLHNNILSYRKLRNFNGSRHVTDFNDGIAVLRQYREAQQNQSIYVADCDIKKFYDTINHDVVRDCFTRMMDHAELSNEGKRQVMRILNAYLASYNFADHVWVHNPSGKELPKFWKAVKARRAHRNGEEHYQFAWVSEKEFLECYGSKEVFESQRNRIGVPQGGSLSLLIANVVLNDVDKDIVTPLPFPHEGDKQKLFLRFCDDMILMHSDKSECERLIKLYHKSLTEHKLTYHNSMDIRTLKNGTMTTRGFWKAKSHEPFLWDVGAGAASEWVGFLGYEIRRNGSIRLRRSNIDRIADKLRRQYLITVRMMKDERVDYEKFQERIKQKQNIIEKSLGYYKWLDINNISQGNTTAENKQRSVIRYTFRPCLLADQLKWLKRKSAYLLRRAACKSRGAQCNMGDVPLQQLETFLRSLSRKEK